MIYYMEKYYLNRENAEYLNEHNIYFRKMLEHEIAYITGFALNMNINKANY